MKTLTFAQFCEGRKFGDLSRFDYEGFGWIYLDALFIEDMGARDPEATERWYLIIANQQYTSNNLTDMEIILYDYAVREEYFLPPSRDIEVVIRLAKHFAARLKSTVGRSKLATINFQNKKQTNPSICHSHDYCDANMVMADAFHELMGRHPDLDRDEDTKLINDAWEVAKAAWFFIDQ